MAGAGPDPSRSQASAAQDTAAAGLGAALLLDAGGAAAPSLGPGQRLGPPALGSCDPAVEAAALVTAALLLVAATVVWRLATSRLVASCPPRLRTAAACSLRLGLAAAFALLVPVQPLPLPVAHLLPFCRPVLSEHLLRFVSAELLAALAPALLIPLELKHQLWVHAIALRPALARVRPLARALAGLEGEGGYCSALVAAARPALQAVGPGGPVPLPDLPSPFHACCMLHYFSVIVLGGLLPTAVVIALTLHHRQQQQQQKQQQRGAGAQPTVRGAGGQLARRSRQAGEEEGLAEAAARAAEEAAVAAAAAAEAASHAAAAHDAAEAAAAAAAAAADEAGPSSRPQRVRTRPFHRGGGTSPDSPHSSSTDSLTAAEVAAARPDAFSPAASSRSGSSGSRGKGGARAWLPRGAYTPSLLERACDHPAAALAGHLARCLLLLLPAAALTWAGLELAVRNLK